MNVFRGLGRLQSSRNGGGCSNARVCVASPSVGLRFREHGCKLVFWSCSFGWVHSFCLFFERVLFSDMRSSVVNFRGVRSWLVRVGYWKCCICHCPLSALNVSEILNVCVSCERSLGS